MTDVVVKRELEAELVPTGDGRTLEVRVVPYNTVARVRDGAGPEYDEMWMPGAFDKNVNAPNRVLVNFEHEPGIQNVVGRGAELHDSEEALDGTFRILPGPDGDKALELINGRVLTGVSLEAVVKKSQRGEDGVVRRVSARLVNIALCRFPAFEGAQVLAVREEPEPEPAPEPEPDPVPAALVGRGGEVDEVLERLGAQPQVQRAISRRTWNGSPSRFTDEQYEASCLLQRPGEESPKVRCSLPVLEPDGEVNADALTQAATRLGHAAGTTPAQRAAAARKLLRYYRQAGMDAPEALRALAAR